MGICRGLSKEEAVALLPNVGDQRWEVPTITEGNSYNHKPHRCIVVEVNREHLWYTVQFESGLRESYKVPKCNQGGAEQ